MFVYWFQAGAHRVSESFVECICAQIPTKKLAVVQRANNERIAALLKRCDEVSWRWMSQLFFKFRLIGWNGIRTHDAILAAREDDSLSVHQKWQYVSYFATVWIFILNACLWKHNIDKLRLALCVRYEYIIRHFMKWSHQSRCVSQWHVWNVAHCVQIEYFAPVLICYYD